MMRRLFLQSILAVLTISLALPSIGSAQATMQAQPGGWCAKCVPPGACQDTGNGEWGYTYCKGLGDGQCLVGGYTCSWSSGALNTVVDQVPTPDGTMLAAVPIAPYVWVGADCATASTTVLIEPSDDSVLVLVTGASPSLSAQS
jgi:hypothetical protein